jgi:hypothetical protein
MYPRTKKRVIRFPRRRRYGIRRRRRAKLLRPIGNGRLINLKATTENSNIVINANQASTYFALSFAASQVGSGSNVVFNAFDL